MVGTVAKRGSEIAIETAQTLSFTNENQHIGESSAISSPSHKFIHGSQIENTIVDAISDCDSDQTDEHEGRYSKCCIVDPGKEAQRISCSCAWVPGSIVAQRARSHVDCMGMKVERCTCHSGDI
eukprot:SAG31_NODE_1283_length_9011_cov_2.475202_2_plen_124_part_00